MPAGSGSRRTTLCSSRSSLDIHETQNPGNALNEARARPARQARSPSHIDTRGGVSMLRCSQHSNTFPDFRGTGSSPEHGPRGRHWGGPVSSWRLGGGGHVCLGAHDLRQGRSRRVPLKPLVPQGRYPRGGSIWGPMLRVPKPGPTPLLGLRLGAWRGPAHLICATRGLHCQPWLYVYIGAPNTLRAPIRAPRRSPRDTGAEA